MNQTSTIDIWRRANRVSRLWEDLLADCVSPDPLPGENTPPGVDLEPASLLEPWEMQVESPAASLAQSESAGPGLLEKAGFESLRLIRHALEVLTAPPGEEPGADTGREQELERLPARLVEWEGTTVPEDRIQADSGPGLVFVKVSSEPEPQPGSTIDTRRMAYGLKIPARPLHKRPIYQRLFFCLRSLIH